MWRKVKCPDGTWWEGWAICDDPAALKISDEFSVSCWIKKRKKLMNSATETLVQVALISASMFFCSGVAYFIDAILW